MSLKNWTRKQRTALSSSIATIVLFTGAITLGVAIYTLLFGVI